MKAIAENGVSNWQIARTPSLETDPVKDRRESDLNGYF